MKKHTIKFGVLIASMVGWTGVHAQSSVTLYGILDDGIRYTSNAGGHSQWQMSSGNLMGSRWGMLGLEDLGGGYKAHFVIEGGFSVPTGAITQGGAIFGRQVYVGLSNSIGRVTLGRQYDVFADNGVAGMIFGNSVYLGGPGQMAGAAGSHPGDIDNLDNTNRVNNAIKFVSNPFGGFKFAGEYGVGGVAGDFHRNQIWSLGAKYEGTNFTLGVGYENISDPNFSFFGNMPSSSATGNNMTSPVYRGYASAGTQTILAGGGAYRFGSLAVGAVYSRVSFKDLGTQPGLNPANLSGDATFNIGEVNLGYTITPAWVVGGSFAYTRGSSVGGRSPASYKQVDLSTDYALSKRTDLYAVVLYQRAGGYDSTLTPAVAAINGFTPSSGRSQTGVMVGMRNRF